MCFSLREVFFFFLRRLPHIIPCFQNSKLQSHTILVFTCVCVYSVACCHKHLTGVLTTPPPSPVPVFLYLTSNPSVPNFLHSRVCSSHLRRLSAIFFFFSPRSMWEQSWRLQAFPHKQPNLSLRFSACLFWVFLRDDISAGKPNSPEPGAFPLGDHHSYSAG